MNAAIMHRGPDSDGFHVAEGVGLAMRRLAIIDVKGGDQPISNEDDSIWIVYNGEIYNYPEMHAELEKRGHHFKTQAILNVWFTFMRMKARHAFSIFVACLPLRYGTRINIVYCLRAIVSQETHLLHDSKWGIIFLFGVERLAQGIAVSA